MAKVAIPTTQKFNIVKKLNKLHDEWQMLKRSKGRKSEFSVEKENTWKEKLSELFDIAHVNANEIITIEEDREFLRLQREDRKGRIMGVDKENAKHREEGAKKQQALEKMQIRPSSTFDETIVLTSSSSSSPREGYSNKYGRGRSGTTLNI